MAKKTTRHAPRNRTDRIDPDEPVLTETILKNKLAPFSEYASITPEAAALLVREGHGDELLSGYSGLTGLTSLSEGVAEYFSQHRGDLKLNLVTEISDSAAASLGKHEGILELKGLTHLSDTAAGSLSNHQGDLVLDGLTTLSDAAAEFLAKHKGLLQLEGLTSLTDSAATSLSRKLNTQLALTSGLADQVQTARKKLDKKSVLDRSQEAKIRKLLKTKETSNVLIVCELLETVDASEEDWLSVFSLYRLKVLLNTWTPEIWDILATAMRDRLGAFEVLIEAASGRFKTYFNRLHPDHFGFISELVETGRKETIELLDFALAASDIYRRSVVIYSTSLSDRAAEILSRVQFDFTVDCLEELADTPGHVALAGSLAKKGSVELNGLTSLSAAAAESLSKHEGPLALPGLTELSDAAAESFSKHKGDSLSLEGLTSLSDAAAESFSKHQGDSLSLEGLTSLSDAAAESLSKYDGRLDLRGLTSLSDAAAESFSKHEGDLDLRGLTSLSDAAAESLSKHEGELVLDGLTSLSDAAAESLSKHEGDLDLRGLTSLSDAAAESLSKLEDYLWLYGLTQLSDAAARSLSTHAELGLYLDNLPESAAQILRDAGHG